MDSNEPDLWRAEGERLQRPRGRQPIAWAARGTPLKGKLLSWMLNKQTIALAGAGILKCRESASPTLRIRGCTYCPGAPARKLSGRGRMGRPSGKCRLK